jgi:DNA-binding GntR family transcriptional regulator
MTRASAADATDHDALSARAHRRITELIRNRGLQGGQVVIEQRLAELLGISRTPLREALQRLEGEGLLVKNGGRSFTVRRVGLQEYLQSLKLRQILEPEAAASAVGRIPPEEIRAARAELEELRRAATQHTEAHWDSDDRVHRLISAHCGNEVMGEVIERLRVTTRLFEITDLQSRVESDFREHAAILDALEAADAAAARKAVRDHARSLIADALGAVR